MAFVYSYTASGSNLDRLRYLVGDHRGVPASYASMALFISGAQALHTDEELTDCLALANGGSAPSAGNGNAIMAAARIALQARAAREATGAGVSGTTDTTDRPTALVNAIRALERLVYLSDALPDSEVRTNVAIDDAGLTDMGDD